MQWTSSSRDQKILEIAFHYGQSPQEEQRLWAIDRIVRLLTESEENYQKFVSDFEGPPDEDGETEFFWNPGSKT